ncbi:MAG: hypothetical protein HOH38_02060 [Nitrospinaceae bacterium]|jgi:hypothetical protein|nr:hypothetical protein [Nitrospina sp.]MBT5867604.1 hypothetical protein [Nitrospinaceae bacterium]MBT6345514.1 hypothetical protein [Nitrospina sp.]
MNIDLNKLRHQILVLLVVACLTGLSGLEPVLHNHDLDQTTHEDCFSCGWTQINLDNTSSLSEAFNASSHKLTSQLQNEPALASSFSSFLSRAPPTLS